MTQIAPVTRCARSYDPACEGRALAADYREITALDAAIKRGSIRMSRKSESLGGMALIAFAVMLGLIAALVALAPDAAHAALISLTRG